MQTKETHIFKCFFLYILLKIRRENHHNCRSKIQTVADQRDTQQSHKITLLRPLAFPPIYGRTLGFFLTVCCEERQMEAREMNEGAVNHGNVTPVICMRSDTCEHLFRSKGSTCTTHRVAQVCGFLSVHGSGYFTPNSLSVGVVRCIGTTQSKDKINRWEKRKWKLQGVPLPANNLAIRSSL